MEKWKVSQRRFVNQKGSFWIKKKLNLPVFEDGVGDVNAHDSVEKKKNQNGKVEPDELVQLPVEEARPKNINYHWFIIL